VEGLRVFPNEHGQYAKRPGSIEKGDHEQPGLKPQSQTNKVVTAKLSEEREF
jgi:hypothetical protein